MGGARLRRRIPVVPAATPAAALDLTPAALEFHPLTPGRWRDLERLFGRRGACGGCWCMVWRLPTRQWEDGKGDANRRAFRRLVMEDHQPGVLAFSGGEPVGWCAVARRGAYSFLERSRVLAPVDDRPVWSVSCLFVLKAARRQGLAPLLLRAAVKLAASRGARIVEGYPVVPRMEVTPDPFLWTGTPAAFRKAGFVEVARRSPTRPVMRRTVR